MSASRPYYDSLEPPDAQLDVVYDSVAAMMSESDELGPGLEQVVGLVVRSISSADGAGVALMRDDKVVLRVASSPLVADADAAQYGVGEGPCLSAVAEGEVVRTNSVRENEERWPLFASAVRELGIASMLSLPLQVRSEVIGSINLYAERGDGFDERDAAYGARLARPVAAAIRSAQAGRNLDYLASQMRDTREAKATVTAAVTLLTERHGLLPSAAMASLSEIAAQRQQSLVDAASALLHPTPRS